MGFVQTFGLLMNPYEILEVPQGASADDIKAAYHRLAKQWHPDRFSGAAKVEAEAKFRALAEAFSMIKDAPRRVDAEPVKAAVPPPAAPAAKPSAEVPPPAATKAATDWFKDAQQAFEAGDFERAAGLASYVLRSEPKRADVHAFLGKALAASGADRRATIKALETAIQLDPKDVESLVMLAEQFQAMGMTARATGTLAKVKALNPRHKALKALQGAVAPPAKAAVEPQPQSLGEQVTSLMGQLKSTLSRFKRK